MKKTGLIIAIVLVVVCGGGIYSMMSALRSSRTGAGPKTTTVERGDIVVQVVETGAIDAVKAVEIKSRVAGRVKELFVDEGSRVNVGDKIAIIDPQETQLRVEQDEAQLRGAKSAVKRADIQIAQQRITARAGYDRARIRVDQLEKELGIQPELTRTSIAATETAYNSAVQAREQLLTSTQPNERTEAKSAVEEATANEENARREYDRRKELLSKGYLSQRDLEAAQLQLSLAATRLQSSKDRLSRLDSQQNIERRQAEERVRQTKADLDRAKANAIQDDLKRKDYEQSLAALREAEAALREVEVLQQGKAQSQASVDQLESVLRDSRRQLGETDILSPIHGIVTKKLVQVGELVASLSSFSSGTPIVKVEDRTGMLVKLDINEIDVAKLRLGMDAEVSVDALPGNVFKGKIAKIAPASKSEVAGGMAQPVVKYEVEVRLADGDDALKSGMSAKCTMTASSKRNVLRIPLEYLGKDSKGYYVALADEGADLPKNAPPVPASKFNRKYIQVGLQNLNSIEITGGVEPGTKIFRPKFSGPERKGAQFGPDEGQR